MTVDYPNLAADMINSNAHIKIPVTGDSMSPVLRTGNIIYVEPVDTGGLSVGDILVYKTNGNMVAHRLVRVSRKNDRCILLTKGDTFSDPDLPFHASDLIGRVYAVEKFGKKFHIKKGIFSIVNRLSCLLSPVSSFVYRFRRRQRGCETEHDTRIKSNEELLVLALLQDEFSEEKIDRGCAALLIECADLSRVLQLAREHGVSQKLYSVLQRLQAETGLACTSEDQRCFFDSLRHDYLLTAAKNTLLYSEFRRVAAALRREKIDVLVMKGAALAELAYRDIGTRGMSDIDLMIKKSDLPQTDDLLRSLGYHALDRSPHDALHIPDNYLTTRDYRSRNRSHPSFHIHWHIVNSSVPAPYSSGIDIHDIWKEAVPVDIAGIRVLSLSPHHFLTHLAEHAMRVTHSASKLIYLMDVSALINAYRDRLDWDKVLSVSRKYGLDIFVRNVLRLTVLRTGVNVPQRVLLRLDDQKRSWCERLFFYVTARGHRVSGLSYMVHLSMVKGLMGRILFIMRTMFPPAWVVAKRNRESCHQNPGRLYLYRVKEVLTGVLSLPVHGLKKICPMFTLGVVAFLIASASASVPAPDTTEGEINSSYIMEDGIPAYMIAPDDVLEIRIWRGFEEKKHEVTVKPDGSIVLAYVSVHVSDKTVKQAEAELRNALKEFIKEPKVEILIKEYRGRKVTLLGAVQPQIRQPTGPGIYSIKGKTTMSQLIIMAGGFSKEAELRNVRITTRDGEIKKVNLFEIMFTGEIGKDIVVDDGDIIFVPYKADTEDYNIFILGEVAKPGIYKLTPELTLLQSLVKAGGFKKDALLDEIRVIRGGLENPQIILADTKAVLDRGEIAKDLLLQNKDIIYIPKTKIGNWNDFIARLRPTLEFVTLPFANRSISLEE